MSVGAYIGIGLVIGGGLGLLIGWLLWRGRVTVVPTEVGLVEELRAQARQHDEEQNKLQAQLQELTRRNGGLDAELKSLKEQLATEETIQEKFRDGFEAISNKLIVDNTSRFNQQSSESLGKLLTPLEKTLGEFKASLETTRTETATHSALLKDQIGRIGTEAANLSKALKGDVKALGNWGENMLDQILEKSALQRDIHYRRQRGAKDMEGDQRFLDVVVDFPEKKGGLIIDSKVSLRAYEESVNAADDEARLAGLERHIEAIRRHFNDLGTKRYQDIEGMKTPDFVLMYVPVEAAFFAAIAHDPGPFSEALERNVVLITNSTLLATLRTVAHIWRLADQQKNALKIADLGGKLHDKFVGFVEDLLGVGKALDAAKSAWAGAENKLHTGSGNLVKQSEKLKELGAKAAKSLPNDLLEKADEQTP